MHKQINPPVGGVSNSDLHTMGAMSVFQYVDIAVHLKMDRTCIPLSFFKASEGSFTFLRSRSKNYVGNHL